jgi:hypothetical protein
MVEDNFSFLKTAYQIVIVPINPSSNIALVATPNCHLISTLLYIRTNNDFRDWCMIEAPILKPPLAIKEKTLHIFSNSSFHLFKVSASFDNMECIMPLAYFVSAFLPLHTFCFLI